MVDAAGQLSTIEEFLRFDDGTDRRYQLIRGAIVKMTPPLEAHGTIVANLVGVIGRQLQPPCRVVIEAGIVLPDRNDTCFQADLAVTCTPHQRGRRWIDQPRLIVEVLSRRASMMTAASSSTTTPLWRASRKWSWLLRRRDACSIGGGAAMTGWSGT